MTETISLNDIRPIAESLKTAPTKSVKLLFNICFDNEIFDRSARNKLRNFSTFPSDCNLEKKKQTILNTYTLTNFICVANLLHINPEGPVESLCNLIFETLNDLTSFKNTFDFTEYYDENENENSNKDSSITQSNVSAHNVGANNIPPDNPKIETMSNSVNNYSSVLNTSVDFSNIFFIMKEIKNSMRSFTGSQNYSIKSFFRDIEDAFNLLPPLTDQHKIIFLKSLLDGPAKLFIQSQQGLNTWDSLKQTLLNEFDNKITSIDLHRMLQNRKLRKNETLLEYFIALRELASHGDYVIDDHSLMEYCISGIPDSQSNKILLYGCDNLNIFKDKLKIYEKLFNERNRNKSYNNYHGSNSGNFRKVENNHSNFASKNERRFENSKSNFQNKQITCFNCMGLNHISKFCPYKNRGPRCAVCKEFGHKSNSCTQQSISNSASNETVNNVHDVTPLTSMLKEIKIGNTVLNCLVDTGSQSTLVNYDTWIRIGSPELIITSNVLTGFGSSKTHVIGSFQTTVIIDGQTFPVQIHVVPNGAMSFNAILGCDVIKQAKISIIPDGVFFSKIQDQTPASINESYILAITDDTPAFDIGPTVKKENRIEIENLLSSYVPRKTKTTNIELNITLTDDKPIFHSPRRLPFAEREIVDKQVDEWLQNKIIEPCSSEYASQVIVVRKKDGTPRVCIDYRKLNRVMVKDHYPLPLIEDILDKLENAKIFTTLDLRNAFFHVPVNENSRHYTAFVTHNGHFQFLCMPFGLSKNPSVFQRYINSVFRELILKGYLLPYQDDLVIPARDEEEAIERLKVVFKVASEYGLEFNFRKCKFLHHRIEFLGHIVENGKLYPSPLKTKAVINYPIPKSSKEVQRYLGLTGYFRKFIPNYSIIARPLSDLLRKNATFNFGPKEQSSFDELKKLLCQEPVLGIYRQHAETELHTDGSIDGLGAVLLQKSNIDNALHPIYYMSRKTSDTQRNYTSYELEVLAIVEALKKFRVYLLGTKFKLVTDCAAFTKTMTKKDLNTRIARWALVLEDYDYTIEHRAGSKLPHVDALSRIQILTSQISDSLVYKIKQAQDSDPHIVSITKLLEHGPYENYTLKNGVLYKFVDGCDLMVVPQVMHTDIIKNAHEQGHFAAKRTIEHLKNRFFIPQLNEKVSDIIANCVKCILANRKIGKKDGFLHPLQKDETPLTTYHIDHLGPLETSNKNYKFIFTVIDAFTKFAWLYPTKSTTSAEVIDKLNIQKATFGNPRFIITDRGSAFTSTEFQEYCKEENIVLSPITTGLPRANGQVERLNRVIISVLSKLSQQEPTKWYKHVAHVQQTLNSTYHRSINTTPFELMFGTPMKVNTHAEIFDILNQEMQAEFQKHRDDLRKDAKMQILKVQEENRKTYNLRRKKASTFRLHDLVAIKRTQFGPSLKLKQKYLGPYKVTKIKGNDTYDVQKCGLFDGPFNTTTCAEFMKPWSNDVT